MSGRKITFFFKKNKKKLEGGFGWSAALAGFAALDDLGFSWFGGVSGTWEDRWDSSLLLPRLAVASGNFCFPKTWQVALSVGMGEKHDGPTVGWDLIWSHLYTHIYR